MTSFFRDQKFPSNWHRRSSPADIDQIGIDADLISNAFPILPGANNASGVYIPDDVSQLNVSSPSSLVLSRVSCVPPNYCNQSCSFYNNLAGDNLPAVLLNTTGLLKKNVDFLLKAINNVFSDCPPAVPNGAAGI